LAQYPLVGGLIPNFLHLFLTATELTPRSFATEVAGRPRSILSRTSLVGQRVLGFLVGFDLLWIFNQCPIGGGCTPKALTQYLMVYLDTLKSDAIARMGFDHTNLLSSSKVGH